MNLINTIKLGIKNTIFNKLLIKKHKLARKNNPIFELILSNKIECKL